jgi:hypothetical protein
MAWRVLQAVLPTLAAGVFAYWLLRLFDSASWPAAALAGAAGLLAWRGTAGQGAMLVWDGQHWTADGVPGQLAVMMDLGPWMLLHLRPDAAGSSRWLAVAVQEAGPAWHGLRAAAYASGLEAVPRRPPADRRAG